MRTLHWLRSSPRRLQLRSSSGAAGPMCAAIHAPRLSCQWVGPVLNGGSGWQSVHCAPSRHSGRGSGCAAGWKCVWKRLWRSLLKQAWLWWLPGPDTAGRRVAGTCSRQLIQTSYQQGPLALKNGELVMLLKNMHVPLQVRALAPVPPLCSLRPRNCKYAQFLGALKGIGSHSVPVVAIAGFCTSCQHRDGRVTKTHLARGNDTGSGLGLGPTIASLPRPAHTVQFLAAHNEAFPSHRKPFPHGRRSPGSRPTLAMRNCGRL
jgi:hypothetical protein